ncbi:glycerophosphoryl diester phosphodiesterase membrane domain-containing protein [Nocardiopsis algeriensis]|uniref:MFS family permease n=1 Tax=Nocardiopsis algeriensis TaxID=1478215 RepID=A0A841IQ14_9ACTN|nr:glycerophosphoryl diester phosphodiesterase membrane domain-containing protein [Nocardiopsis algeriensis]MBB6118755.1 MFS family permease [Nocardiopsis algeriensis]
MSQEDGHRDVPGENPGESAGSGASEPGAAADDWAAPGGDGRPASPPPAAPGPGFAAPGSGQAPPAPSYGAPQPGYGPPGAQWQQGQQPPYGHGAPGANVPPGYGPPGAQWQQGQQPPYGHGTQARPAAPRPGVVSLRPMTLGDVLNGAFTLIRHNPKTMVGLSLLVMSVAGIVSAFGMTGYMADYGLLMEQTLEDPYYSDPDNPLGISGWSLLGLLGGSLLTSLGLALVTGLLTVVVGMAVLGYKLGPGEAWTAVRGRIWPIIGLSVLQSLILFAALTAAVLVGFIGIFLSFAVVAVGNEVVGVLLLFAFIVVMFALGFAVYWWFAVRINFAMSALVLEGLGVGGALARSWRLTEGSRWRVFGILLLTTILAYFVVNILVSPFQIGGLLLSMGFPGVLWAAVVAGVLSFAGTTLAHAITAPFQVGVSTLLYVDLRMRREGLDLKLHSAVQSGRAVGPEIYLPGHSA